MLRTRKIYETVTIEREIPAELVPADKKLRPAKRKTPEKRIAQREWDRQCLSQLDKLWQWMIVNRGGKIGFFDMCMRFNPLREGVVTRFASLIDVPEYRKEYRKMMEGEKEDG